MLKLSENKINSLAFAIIGPIFSLFLITLLTFLYYFLPKYITIGFIAITIYIIDIYIFNYYEYKFKNFDYKDITIEDFFNDILKVLLITLPYITIAKYFNGNIVLNLFFYIPLVIFIFLYITISLLLIFTYMKKYKNIEKLWNLFFLIWIISVFYTPLLYFINW